MALAFLQRYTVHADHPALAASCRVHGWESLDDILTSSTASSAEGLAAAGISTPFAVQKVLHELRKLGRSTPARTRSGREHDAACTLQATCRSALASKDFLRNG